MSTRTTRTVDHEIEVAAPADRVYDLIAEVTNWPRVFPPTVHVERLEGDDTGERIRIWATAKGEAKVWTSRRTLDRAARRIEFRQEVSQAPVGSMGGRWVIEPVTDGSCRVRLFHDYRAVDDDPAKLAWIDEAVDRNSRAELGALRSTAEGSVDRPDLLLTFDDAVDIDGSAKDVYDFLDQADRWKDRLPHVSRVVLTEDTPGLQMLEMDTRTRDGSVHTTKSVRVCFPSVRIVYKQIVLPALMTLHTGHWVLDETAGGVRATSRHTVAVNEEAIAGVLGADATVEDARTFVRDALGNNSRATLGHAKEYAERRR